MFNCQFVRREDCVVITEKVKSLTQHYHTISVNSRLHVFLGNHISGRGEGEFDAFVILCVLVGFMGEDLGSRGMSPGYSWN